MRRRTILHNRGCELIGSRSDDVPLRRDRVEDPWDLACCGHPLAYSDDWPIGTVKTGWPTVDITRVSFWHEHVEDPAIRQAEEEEQLAQLEPEMASYLRAYEPEERSAILSAMATPGPDNHGPVMMSLSPPRNRVDSPRDVVDDLLYADGTRCTRHVDGTQTWWTPLGEPEEVDR